MLHGKYLHIKCIAHIVNLIVNNEIKGLGSLVAQVHSTVKYVSSPSRLQKFKTCVEIEKIEWSKTVFGCEYEMKLHLFNVEYHMQV